MNAVAEPDSRSRLKQWLESADIIYKEEYYHCISVYNVPKIQRELDWAPEETFESGIRKTVTWYLENLEWAHRVLDGSYQRERLGSGK